VTQWYECLVKTTIELPDTMLYRANAVAAERRMTLHDLVFHALEQVLAEKSVQTRDRATKLFAEMDRLPVFAAKNRLSRTEAHAR
jgi:hypothetical protein